MPRLARVVAVDTPHHVTQRGNGRQEVFFTDNDRLVYLSLLQQHSRRLRLDLLGYCLIPNHVHLIVVPHAEEALPRVLHQTHGRYAAYLNSRRSASGHVWQGRYYSCPMDENHLWTALRYVERNPVRAGMVGQPADYAWSSARAHTSGDRDPLIDVTEWSARWTVNEWSDFLMQPSAGQEADRVRRSTHCGRPLGSAEFVERLEKQLERPLQPQKGGRPRKKNPGTDSTFTMFPTASLIVPAAETR